IVGALDDETWAQAAPRVIVLPGTHSKWALVRGRTIQTFATFMTGELYAVLREHSILGRLAAAGGRGDDAAMERGVRLSLLGAAVAAGRRWLERHAVMGGSVILVGEAALCERYRRTLALAGIEAMLGASDAAARGLWRIARHSGMVTP